MQEELLKKIVRGNGHNHFVIETEDRDDFVAAGFVVCGTVSENLKVYLTVRMPADYEKRTSDYQLGAAERDELALADDAATEDESGSGATVGIVMQGDADDILSDN